jgi:hypothetical protein
MKRGIDMTQSLLITGTEEPYEVKTNEYLKKQRRFFKGKPHWTMDNCFGGEKIDDYAGRNGYGLMHTVRRDLLPPDIPEKYFHKKTTQNLNQQARVARFNHPITAVKTVSVPPSEPGLTPTSYFRVHISFQSTEALPISEP